MMISSNQNANSIKNEGHLHSIKSNMGSIQSSVVKLKSQSVKSSIGKIINTKHPPQQQQPKVVHWQAVYIQGKFYLTDKQTVQRYYQIQHLLQSQKQSKLINQQKNTTEGDFNKNTYENNRINNLQTIKVKEDLSQSQKQKLQDESLLNNINVSTSECFSRFTLNQHRQIQDKTQNQNIFEKNQTNVQVNIMTKNQVNDPKNINVHFQQQHFNNISRIKALSQLLNENKKQNKGSYYLSANNKKIYKNQNQLTVQQIHLNDGKYLDESSQHDQLKLLQRDRISNRFSSLTVQKKDQLPVFPKTNRLKILSKFNSLNSDHLQNPNSLKVHDISVNFNEQLPKQERKSHPILSNHQKVSTLTPNKNKYENRRSIVSSFTYRELPKTQVNNHSHFQKIKKKQKIYDLPLIYPNEQMISSNIHKRQQSVGQKIQSAQKTHQSKLFQQVENLRQSLSKPTTRVKNRLNGFIKNFNQKHEQLLQLIKENRNSRKSRPQNQQLSGFLNIQTQAKQLRINSRSVVANLDNNIMHEQNPQITDLRMKRDQFIQKLSVLQKQHLQSEIHLIKKSIKEIEITKLNKMSKTIDLSQNQHQKHQQIYQTQAFKTKLNEILRMMPEQLKMIKKPSDIANIQVPKLFLQNPKNYKISAKMKPQQLQQMAIKVYKLFGVIQDPQFQSPSLLTLSQKPQLSLKNKQKLLIKKFKNCVFFDIIIPSGGRNENKTIIWNFQDEGLKSHKKSFYIGGWAPVIKESSQLKSINQTIESKGVKNGYGLEINQKYIYEGQYFNGKKHGFGKLQIISSGYRYQGQFIDNFQSGHGKQYMPLKQEIYLGQFYKGKRHGKGYLKKLYPKEKNKVNKIVNKICPYYFEGTFSNGMKENGKQIFQTGNQYQGQYLSEKFHGKGTFKWLNGSQYEGQFCQNFRHGFGKWQSSTDSENAKKNFYIGEFKKNLKHGQGKYIYKNGAYYQGGFQNDLKHGQGALFYEGKNGEQKILRGIWKEGNIMANQKGQIFKMRIQKQQIN